MTYCPNCGSAVEGRFCPKCGTAASAGTGATPPTGGTDYVPPTTPPGSPSGYPPGPTGYAPPPAAGLGMEENLASALCYIPIVGLIFLLIEPYNKNKTIRFHAFQSIFYCLAWIVVSIAVGILFAIMFAILPYGVWTILRLLSTLIHLGFVVGWIFMAVKAYQGERFMMPVIGPLAAKQA